MQRESGGVTRTRALLGAVYEVVEIEASARTATDAAAALGCSVAQIAKSLIFRTIQSDKPILVVASGVNRVDEAAVSALLGEPIGRADAAFVRATTGFAIGGVPPIGHTIRPITLLDEDLRQYERIWAAAGSPNAVFSASPEQLSELTHGRYARVALDRGQ